MRGKGRVFFIITASPGQPATDRITRSIYYRNFSALLG
jgi:hypothetical protein